MAKEADVIVVGAGLAGLVATHELVKAGRKVLVVVDQENVENLGGQAFLVTRRPVPGGQPRATPHGHQGLP